ncbi:hypothetical protein C9374_013907 [Naegleria lovaniensis]|uniref:ceramidase n=1 Tax=Naegleria lovaniensis TaxID=51637 RepID=A0AA88GUX7_NAELO|nr:uncharacterized protein C9374_013907 [Naegleria lovaniensis]KAG2389347.1 hypothetical protein C9374_013907 [Naegleria lovaniensis]
MSEQQFHQTTDGSSRSETPFSSRKQEIPLYCSEIEIGDLDDEITPISDLGGNVYSFATDEEDELVRNEKGSISNTLRTISCRTNVPEYEINLDLPPNERWTNLVDDYKEKFPALIKFLEGEMNDVLGGGIRATFAKTFLNMIFNVFTNSGAVYYSQELKAVAQQANLPLGLLAFMQLSYELFACCTSVVKENSDGFPIHVRTMDWAMDLLKEYTVQLNFTRNGKTLFKASSWAGYLGVLTGCRPNGFSISINFRSTEDGHFGKNIIKTITRGWPISFLVRETLQDCETYSHAVAILKNSKLIAPVYITVAGCKKGEGTIITRQRETFSSDNYLISLQDLHNNTQISKQYYLKEANAMIQANADWWKSLKEIKDQCNILLSSERLSKAFKHLKKMPQELTTIDSVTDMFSKYGNYPLKNETTIYITAMNPSNGDYATILV